MSALADKITVAPRVTLPPLPPAVGPLIASAAQETADGLGALLDVTRRLVELGRDAAELAAAGEVRAEAQRLADERRWQTNRRYLIATLLVSLVAIGVAVAIAVFQ